ncbi:hypothetical protein PFFVO_03564 [Plasmodium falciparum Vietnam Oak-Knoll (FVO)]|uniref:Uncharacterized protein n=1 Tax=Plasmodium falciparum Vietnam Oak-Knoll (FVO) TaxID=1036723 RepID=A0A024V3X8_PLAFA|nr:hypothetical protein PFFVO_03564 [Plasmodium falciparum Vietnam Oak-Knoll (FVO)]
MGFYSWFTFYLNRHDGLIYYFEIKDYKLMEYFINRNDNVIYRSVKLSQKIPTIYKLQLKKNKFQDEKIICENDFYIHMWILIKKSLDLKKDVFIEMSSGREYDIYDCPYKSIFYLWNEKNIYININKTGDIQTLMSQIKNNEYFVPAFYEEIKNKSLTPIIENKFYVIRKDRFLLKYPQGSNIIFYKNCKKDDYGEFLQMLYLLKEEVTFFEDIKYMYQNVICSIMKEKEDINKMEGEYQYMANNITNLSEIIYHDNEKINFFNKSLMEDNLNIYNFYKNYPWNDYLEISMKNDFFMSKNKMLQIENAPQEIDYVNSYQKIKKSNEIKKST